MHYPIINVFSKQYPVGQGGLHLSIIECISNKISTHAYIYDCGSIEGVGSETNFRNQINNLYTDIIVQRNFCFYRDYPLLDNLYVFISHLHQDHFNGLLYLKDIISNNLPITKSRPYLMLPYMDKTEIDILIEKYTENDDFSKEDYKNFLQDPNKLFDDFFEIIYITNRDDFLYNTTNPWPDCNKCNGKITTSTDEDGKQVMHHNQEIHIGNDDDNYWVLKAFCNPISLEEREHLREIINDNFSLQSAETLTQNRIGYQSVLGTDLNMTSLCLYSGPASKIDCNGFMHTGDISFSRLQVLDNFTNHYIKYLSNVSLAQIPHHGSARNSNLIDFNIFPNLKLLYITKQEQPIGRMQPTLSPEYENQDFVKQVTENSNTAFAFRLSCATDYYLQSIWRRLQNSVIKQ